MGTHDYFNILEENVNKFKEITGVDILQTVTRRIYNGKRIEDIGGAVNVVLNGGADKVKNRLKNLQESAESILNEIKLNIDKINT